MELGWNRPTVEAIARALAVDAQTIPRPAQAGFRVWRAKCRGQSALGEDRDGLRGSARTEHFAQYDLGTVRIGAKARRPPLAPGRSGWADSAGPRGRLRRGPFSAVLGHSPFYPLLPSSAFRFSLFARFYSRQGNRLDRARYLQLHLCSRGVRVSRKCSDGLVPAHGAKRAMRTNKGEHKGMCVKRCMLFALCSLQLRASARRDSAT